MFGGVGVNEKDIALFDRATSLLARMDKEPTVVAVTAAFLDSRDRVKELEAEIAQLKQVN